MQTEVVIWCCCFSLFCWYLFVYFIFIFCSFLLFFFFFSLFLGIATRFLCTVELRYYVVIIILGTKAVEIDQLSINIWVWRRFLRFTYYIVEFLTKDVLECITQIWKALTLASHWLIPSELLLSCSILTIIAKPHSPPLSNKKKRIKQK